MRHPLKRQALQLRVLFCFVSPSLWHCFLNQNKKQGLRLSSRRGLGPAEVAVSAAGGWSVSEPLNSNYFRPERLSNCISWIMWWLHNSVCDTWGWSQSTDQGLEAPLTSNGMPLKTATCSHHGILSHPDAYLHCALLSKIALQPLPGLGQLKLHLEHRTSTVILKMVIN